MDYNNATNQLQYWNSAAWIPITNAASGTGWALSGNHIYSSNTGFVGIGTTTPLHKLSVVTPTFAYGLTHSDGNITMGSWLTATTAQFGTKTNHPLQFFTNNGSAQMTILQNGNVGIGTTNPSYNLDIVTNVNVISGMRMKNTSSTSVIDIDAYTGDAALRFLHNGSYKWVLRNYSTNDGFQITDDGSPKFMIENGSGKIGFNTLTPQSNLHINPSGAGSILIGTDKYAGGFTNLEMGISAQSGGQSFIQSTKVSGSAYGTLQLNPSGGDVTIAGNIGIGTNTPFSPLDIINPGGLNPALRILAPGHIWSIYSAGGLFFTHNNGQIGAYILETDGSYNAFSDKRLKKNIEEFSPVLDKVLQLKAKKYQFNDTEVTSKKSIGFISQEVNALFPELVSSTKRNAEDSTLYYGINYAGFSVIAIKAIQEQQLQIQSLQLIIDTQNKKLIDIQTRLEAIESKIKN